MRRQNRLDLISRTAAMCALMLILEFSPAITMAQSKNADSAGATIPISTASDRIANQLVFESEAITIRHITLPPDTNGYEYWHPGGSIILLRDYSFKMPIPLDGKLDGELKVGDVIQIAAGKYVLGNPTPQPLEFLSIERKQPAKAGQ